MAEVARAVNYRGASYYEIPTDPARYGQTDAEGLKNLAGNYLVLLAGSMDTYSDDPLETFKPAFIRRPLASDREGAGT